MRLQKLLQGLVARWRRARASPRDVLETWATTEPVPLAFQAEAEIRRQLDWTGPTGKPMGHVVLSRRLAAALIEYQEPIR